jgi:hypothetical protein
MTAVRITNPSDLKMSRPGLILFWPFWRLCHTLHTSLTISEEEIKEGCAIA